MTPVSAIDIGSNAIRLAIAERDGTGNLVVKKKVRTPIRLGHDVFSTGQISGQTIEKVIQAFAEYKQIIADQSAAPGYAVATSATREAENGLEFCNIIAEQTDIKIDVISGQREAELLFHAVAASVDLQERSALLLDIGGGSIELSVVRQGQLVEAKSFPFGTVRIMEEAKKHGLSESHYNMIVGSYADEIYNSIADTDFDFCVGTGGNLECLGKLHGKLFGGNDKKLKSTQVDLISQYIRDMQLRDRVSRLGLREDRADVIVPALLTIQLVLRQSRCQELRIPYVGLKDGILLSLFK